jgi:hypothetical protein
MSTATLVKIVSSYRSAGRAAIASGITGIIAILIAFLATRDKDLFGAFVTLRIHDVGVIIQFILLIPPVICFYKLYSRNPMV